MLCIDRCIPPDMQHRETVRLVTGRCFHYEGVTTGVGDEQVSVSQMTTLQPALEHKRNLFFDRA